MPFPTGFDVNNPADLALLKAEMNGLNGPISIAMDYDSVITSVPKSIALINLPKNNAQDPTPTTGRLLVSDLFAAIDPSELSAQQVDNGKLIYVQGLMSRDLGENIAAYISQLQIIFGSQTPNTLAALTALLRDQARYEVLFGVDTSIITSDQWRTARDS